MNPIIGSTWNRRPPFRTPRYRDLIAWPTTPVFPSGRSPEPVFNWILELQGQREIFTIMRCPECAGLFVVDPVNGYGPSHFYPNLHWRLKIQVRRLENSIAKYLKTVGDRCSGTCLGATTTTQKRSVPKVAGSGATLDAVEDAAMNAMNQLFSQIGMAGSAQAEVSDSSSHHWRFTFVELPGAIFDSASSSGLRESLYTSLAEDALRELWLNTGGAPLLQGELAATSMVDEKSIVCVVKLPEPKKVGCAYFVAVSSPIRPGKSPRVESETRILCLERGRTSPMIREQRADGGHAVLSYDCEVDAQAFGRLVLSIV